MGGDGRDTLKGAGYLDGGAGNDTITSHAGDDIMGGDGKDTITIGKMADEVDGGAGNDTIKAKFADLHDGAADADNPGDADDVIDGGSGTDILELDDPSATSTTHFIFDLGAETVGTRDITAGTGVTISTERALSAENTVTLDLSSIESVTGDKGHDVIMGDGRNNGLKGGAGQDYIHGMSGDDKIEGGDGDDVLLFGCSGNDTILGGNGDDLLVGVKGEDSLDGGDGADTLWGDGVLDADGDSVIGGAAADIAKDTFVFGNGDTVMDWDAKDKIDISGMGITKDEFYDEVMIIDGETAAAGVDPIRGQVGDNNVGVVINGRLMIVGDGTEPNAINVSDISMGDFLFADAT
jgi:Ca2+-binding RTX toxin-like protein